MTDEENVSLNIEKIFIDNLTDSLHRLSEEKIIILRHYMMKKLFLIKQNLKNI